MAGEKVSVVVSEGDVIAEALESLYGDGKGLRESKVKSKPKDESTWSIWSYDHDTLIDKYKTCLVSLRSGNYTQQDLILAQELLGKGTKYAMFDLEAAERENVVLRNVIKDLKKSL